MLCSQWPVARVSFFTEGTQYQAIWLRMNKNVICVRFTSRARAVLFSSCNKIPIDPGDRSKDVSLGPIGQSSNLDKELAPNHCIL